MATIIRETETYKPIFKAWLAILGYSFECFNVALGRVLAWFLHEGGEKL